MRMIRSTAVLAGLLLAVPALSLASSQTSTQAKPATTKMAQVTPAKSAPAARPAAATHATSGVIKSLDAVSLVITKRTGKVKEMTFALNPTTQRKGNLAVGSPVEVRYRTQGSENIATAVTVQAKKK